MQSVFICNKDNSKSYEWSFSKLALNEMITARILPLSLISYSSSFECKLVESE